MMPTISSTVTVKPARKLGMSPSSLSGRHRRRGRVAPVTGYVCVPKVVVLLGPIAIDAAGPHCTDGAFHADGADIDVTDDQRDHQEADECVHELRPLHAVVAEPMKREH